MYGSLTALSLALTAHTTRKGGDTLSRSLRLEYNGLLLGEAPPATQPSNTYSPLPLGCNAQIIYN